MTLALSSETVRFMFGGELYEASFSADGVRDVKIIQYRIAASGVQEMKRTPRLNGYCQGLHDLDPAILVAAQSARGSARNDLDVPFREAALAALHKRRAKLLSFVEKIDAAIASMQCN
jgi:hypothetical protein